MGIYFSLFIFLMQHYKGDGKFKFKGFFSAIENKHVYKVFICSGVTNSMSQSA